MADHRGLAGGAAGAGLPGLSRRGLRRAGERPHPLDESLRTTSSDRQHGRQRLGPDCQLDPPDAVGLLGQHLQIPQALASRRRLRRRGGLRHGLPHGTSSPRRPRPVQWEKIVQPAILELLVVEQRGGRVARAEYSVPGEAGEEDPHLDGALELYHAARLRDHPDADGGAVGCDGGRPVRRAAQRRPFDGAVPHPPISSGNHSSDSPVIYPFSNGRNLEDSHQ